MLTKGYTLDVLDHGYVKFVDSMGSDEDIIEAARMSTGRDFVSWSPYVRCKQCDAVHACGGTGGTCSCGGTEFQAFPQGDFGMLEFLYENRHMTPFEMGEMVIEVKAPIFVFREWHRHRTQSYNEFSARYAQMPNEHYLPELKRFQKQSTANKQSSAEAFDEALAKVWQSTLYGEQEAVYGVYNALVGGGLAKEVARINTPVSRYSKMRAKANLRNWLGFLLLRKESHHSKPQWEIAQFANAVGHFIQQVFPKTYDLFMEYTFDAVTFSRTEMAVLREYIRWAKSRSDTDVRPLTVGHSMSDKKAKAFLAKLEAA